MEKLLKILSDMFNAKTESIKEASERMSNYINKYYRPEERVLVIKRVEAKILSDMITEKEEHELKVDEYIKAINNLKRK